MDKTLSFIVDMVLLGKIDLYDIPAEIRTKEIALYITAFRRAREVSMQEYNRILETLAFDLDLYSESEKRFMFEFYNEMKENIQLCKRE